MAPASVPMAAKKKTTAEKPGRTYWRPDQTAEERIVELEEEVRRLLTERRELIDRIKERVEDRLFDLDSISNDISNDLDKIAEEERACL